VTPQLVFVGSVNTDTIAVVPKLPGTDERLLAREIVHGYGGNAATAAVAAARLGAESAFVGPIADDDQGRLVEVALAREGVDTSGLVTIPAGSGGESVVLVDESSGTRAICVRRPPAFTVPAEGVAADLVRRADWVHVDYLGWSVVRDLVGDRLHRVSVDAGNDVEGLDLRGLGLYGPTVPALRRAYGDLSPEDLVRQAQLAGALCVVATNGPDGCVAVDEAGVCVEAGGFAVEVASSLGAGDVFHGALLVALARGDSLPEAMIYANGAAALSCRAVDGRSGIPTDEELRGWLAVNLRGGAHG
jgi:sugar/nucleoside kinase (ribokinase family)